MDENDPQSEQSPIRRSFTLNDDKGIQLEQKGSSKGAGRTIILIVALLIILLGGGFFLNKIFHPFSRVRQAVQSTPVTTPAPLPTSSPEPILNRSDWSFEVLNGTGVVGEAKKVAEKIQALGYPVVKTGNADKSNYSETQILVKKDLSEKIDLVVADLKDAIRIASVAGELTEGTASARIIIGKDSI